MRYLASALLTEGESDRAFLPPVLQRQLEDIGCEAGFDVGGVRTGKIRTVGESELVSAEAAELLGECDLLMVHHDYRERGKIDTLRGRLSAGGGLVGVVPIRETEAWVLVAMYDVGVPGLDPACRPNPLHAVEKDPDPTATLGRAYRRGDPILGFTRAGEQVDLAVLGQLPAYQELLDRLNAALKELHFL